MVWLRDDGLVGLQEHLRLLVVHMERPQYQYEPRKGRVGRDALQPVVVDVEEDHLRLRGLQDEIAELFNLEARLERQLELAALDHYVREVQQVNLQRVQHPFAGHDDLLRLLFHGQRAHEGGHLLCCLPLG